MERTHATYVIGNGPSLTPELLESLDAPAFAVNRIWKMFERTIWRPQYYVRAEVPSYNPEHVKEDLYEMGRVGCVMYLQDGFRSLENRNPHPATVYEYFKTCDGSPHDWHLPVRGLTLPVASATQTGASLPAPRQAGDHAQAGTQTGLPGVCGYGTVVHVAIQLAVLAGFDEIRVIGCGGDGHFYDEPFTNSELAEGAHEIAKRCCPVKLVYGVPPHG